MKYHLAKDFCAKTTSIDSGVPKFRLVNSSPLRCFHWSLKGGGGGAYQEIGGNHTQHSGLHWNFSSSAFQKGYSEIYVYLVVIIPMDSLLSRDIYVESLSFQAKSLHQEFGNEWCGRCRVQQCCSLCGRFVLAKYLNLASHQKDLLMLHGSSNPRSANQP